MSRILCMDFGYKRVGFAISDPSRILASPLSTFVRSAVKNKKASNKPKQNLEKPDFLDVVEHCKKLYVENKAGLLVIGLPLRTDAKEAVMAEKVKEIQKYFIEVEDIPTEVYDERYTSVIAQRIMQETNVSKFKKKEKVDSIAAQIILQDYLEMLINTGRGIL